MRLLSYNIHGCVGRDGVADPARILEVIAAADADVVALQEVHDEDRIDRSFLRALEDLGAYAEVLYGPTMRRHDGHYGNVLLTRDPVRWCRRIDLSVGGREPRGAIRVLLEREGGLVEVTATHLGLRPAERRWQIRRLCGDGEGGSEERALADGVVRVVLGDFNEWLPVGRAARMLRRCFGGSRRRATFPAWCPLLALDRCWVRPEAALVGVWTLRDRVARTASDHLPLVAEIDLRAG